LPVRIGRGWKNRFAIALALLAFAVTSHADEAHTNGLNREPLVREAYDHFYQLDYPGAVARFEQFHAQHPGDPQGTALLLNAVLFQELYRLDLLDTSFYSNDSFVSGKRPNGQDPKVRDRIFALTDEAVHEADWRLSQNAKDIDALYARGWARSLKATYLALVERGFAGGLRLSIEAKNDHQRVLELDPSYTDAKLVFGIYEYVVGSLPLPFRMLVSAAGFSGSKSKGMAMLRDAADHGTITSVEARTTMALFLRRDGKYAEAMQVVSSLKNQYPHDFLFCLEEANLRRDSGGSADAATAYRALIEQASQPGFFPSAHVDLAWYGLGQSLHSQRRYDEAAQAYEHAASLPTAGVELKRRSLVAAGNSHDVSRHRQQALEDYQAVIQTGSDSEQADIARRYINHPYQQN
jgi:tetratricopeptide (TPR) repeat protein